MADPSQKTSVQAGGIELVVATGGGGGGGEGRDGGAPPSFSSSFDHPHPHPAKRSLLQGLDHPFFKIFGLFEAAILILYGIFAEYDLSATHLQRAPMFMDVHVMILVGFGFLMTFLRKNGYNSIGINLLIACVAAQLFPLVQVFWHNALFASWKQGVRFNVGTLITADFCAGSILISFGALLGKTTPSQMFVIAIAETVLYSLNETIGIHMNVSDLGGSMVIHLFGACFGLAASYRLTTPRKAQEHAENNAAVYHSDLFSMIGTLFLFLCWPSFNAAFANEALQSQALVNTYLSLAAAAVAAFAFSAWLRGENKFCMVDVQNATLAGGVAMGTCADMTINPAVAIAIGLSAGCISVFGFVVLLPYLQQRFRLHDTCGVLHLHGIPAFLGGTYGAIAAAFTSRPTGPLSGGHQFAYIFITLSIGIAGGYLVGWVVTRTMKNADLYFNDSEAWELPATEIPYFFDTRGENQHTTDFGMQMRDSLRERQHQLLPKKERFEDKKTDQNVQREQEQSSQQ
jgi:ammonium transporter Rh